MFNLMGNNGVVYIHTNLPDITLPKDDEEDVFNVSGLLPIIPSFHLQSPIR